MKTKAMITMLISVAMILTTPLVTLGAGPGGGGGSGGGNAGTAAGALYGDLYVIERDGNGEPVLRSKTISGVTYTCQQPLAAGCAMLPLNYDKGDFNPEEDACAVQALSADLLQEVKFGRESVSRAPASVIDKSYAEALKMINLAAKECGETSGEEPAIKLDPAGRIMLCIPQEDTDAYAWKTIDAPLENLGLYRAVMTDGCFGPIVEVVVREEGGTTDVTTELYDNYNDPDSVGYLDSENKEDAVGYLEAADLDHLLCSSDSTVTKKDMLSGAVFIAAGADKTSPITLDEIINVNTYLGVNTYPPVTKGKTRTLGEVTYFDFNGFTYDFRTDACKTGTMATLLVKNNDAFSEEQVNVFLESPNGVDLRSEGNGVQITVCREGSPLGKVCDDPDASGCGGANWFTQAAEDARKTIWYLHNWRVPEIAY